jgi:hypothetical protein
MAFLLKTKYSINYSERLETPVEEGGLQVGAPLLLRGVSSDSAYLSIPSIIQQEITRSRSFGSVDNKKQRMYGRNNF